jgi:hypothetical protein
VVAEGIILHAGEVFAGIDMQNAFTIIQDYGVEFMSP